MGKVILVDFIKKKRGKQKPKIRDSLVKLSFVSKVLDVLQRW